MRALRSLAGLALLLAVAGCGTATGPSAVFSPEAVTTRPAPAASPVTPLAAATPTPSAAPTPTPSAATAAPSVAPSAVLTSVPTRLATVSAAPSIVVPTLPSAVDRGLVEGADVSWPQCPKGMGIPQKRTQGKPMPLSSARFVVLGLTNGPGFVANPCLSSQMAWVEQRHLMAAAYSVISAPYGDQLARYGRTGPYDASTPAGRLANVGYEEAAFDIATMNAAGLQTPVVWLDIEPVSGFDWPADTAANAAVVQGAVKGYQDAGYDVGVYSITSLWRRVVGTLQLGLPEWRPAGGAGRAEALARCGGAAMFQGGAAVLAQWVEQDRDRDVTCPGQSVYLSLWFHQY